MMERMVKGRRRGYGMRSRSSGSDSFTHNHTHLYENVCWKAKEIEGYRLKDLRRTLDGPYASSSFKSEPQLMMMMMAIIIALIPRSEPQSDDDREPLTLFGRQLTRVPPKKSRRR